MKHRTLITLGLLLGASLFASAQNPAPKRPPGGKLPPALLKEFDKDGDGKLSDEEKAAMKAARAEHKQEMLKKFDSDGDGKLSDPEREAMRAAREGKGKDKAKDACCAPKGDKAADGQGDEDKE